MTCPDCGGPLDWTYDHTDAAGLDCDAQFRIVGGQLQRADGLVPVDEILARR